MNADILRQVEAEVATIELRCADIRRLLAQLAAQLEPAPVTTDTVLHGFVRPLTGFSTNIRERASVNAPKIGTLLSSDVEETAGSVYDEDTPGRYLWHKLARGGFVRADVVLYSNTK